MFYWSDNFEIEMVAECQHNMVEFEKGDYVSTLWILIDMENDKLWANVSLNDQIFLQFTW